MGEVLSYSIVSGLLMLAMYLAYRILLARENQHGFNRGVLLLIYLLSFSASPFFLSFGMPDFQAEASVSTFRMEMVRTAVSDMTVPAKPVWGTILIWIFIAGMAIVAIRTILTWIRLIEVIRSGEKISHDGFTLVVTDNERYAPFSWLRYIVISRTDYDSGFSAIAVHEFRHVRCHHWIDLLIAQMVCVVNWFNPAAWLMRDELMLVHEYQADMAVVDSGFDAKEYQMLLIKKAVGSRFPSLANSLNHSNLKKRINMMYKSKSRAGRRLKALALVPVLALALGLSAVPALRAAVTTIIDSPVSISRQDESQPDKKVHGTRAENNNNIASTEKNGEKPSGIEVIAVSAVKKDIIATDENNDEIAVKCTDNNGNPTIYLDGKAISDAELQALNRNEIATIDVNTEENWIKVTTKKANQTTTAEVPKKVTTEKIPHYNLDRMPDDVTIYVDGKKLSKVDEINAISPDKIESISVEKGEENVIIITTKK